MSLHEGSFHLAMLPESYFLLLYGSSDVNRECIWMPNRQRVDVTHHQVSAFQLHIYPSVLVYDVMPGLGLWFRCGCWKK